MCGAQEAHVFYSHITAPLCCPLFENHQRSFFFLFQPIVWPWPSPASVYRHTGTTRSHCRWFLAGQYNLPSLFLPMKWIYFPLSDKLKWCRSPDRSVHLQEVCLVTYRCHIFVRVMGQSDVRSLPSTDGVGERLHGDRDDVSSGGRWRETVRAILAWWGLITLPHLWGSFPVVTHIWHCVFYPLWCLSRNAISV